jgi:hypothetical protein
MVKSKMLFLSLSAALLAGCVIPTGTSITGSGNLVTREETYAGFDKVDVSNAFEIDISQDASFSTVISFDDNLAQYLRVVKDGNTLKIGLRPGRLYNIRNATLQAKVAMPVLTGLDASGASRCTVTGFKSARNLSVDVSGSSSLRGDIEAGDATFDVSGSGQVTLAGLAQNVTIDASGGSEVNLADFRVNDAAVDASGSSTVTVNVAGRLDAEASGSSGVYYLGNPALGDTNTSGSSTIKHR